MHKYDRWGILNDFWACVFAGYANLSDLLEIMSWYDSEDEVFVLRELASQCTEISQLLQLKDNGQKLLINTDHRSQAHLTIWDGNQIIRKTLI